MVAWGGRLQWIGSKKISPYEKKQILPVLLIRRVFNVTSYNSDCLVPNDSVILNNELRKARKEVVVASTILHLPATTDITNAQLKT
jgi:hypothetical protein